MSDPDQSILDHFKASAAFFQTDNEALKQGEPATPQNVFSRLKEFFEKGTSFIPDKSYGFFGSIFPFGLTQHLTYSTSETESGIEVLNLEAYDGRQGGHAMGLLITLFPPHDTGNEYQNTLAIFHGYEHGENYMGNYEVFDVSAYSCDEAVGVILKKLADEENYWPFGRIFKKIKSFATQAPALTK